MSDITRPGREMYERFMSLGDMNGKKLSEIIAYVGSPTSISAMADNERLIQWQATGFHAAIMFDRDDNFFGITHQYGNFEQAPAGCLSLVLFLVGAGTVTAGAIIHHFV